MVHHYRAHSGYETFHSVGGGSTKREWGRASEVLALQKGGSEKVQAMLKEGAR